MSKDDLIDELKKAGISTHEQVNAIFAGTQDLCQAAIPIRNVIMALGDNRTDLEDALAGTYYRMCLLMESLVRLNRRQDFQVALHCARCMYELHLDAVDLTRNPALLSKFHAFTFVARFAAADKLVDQLNAQGITDPAINKHERQFIADPKRQARFNSERATHWPDKRGKPTTPLNWTGQPLPVRAENIGPAELLRYRRLYSYLCWFSHAGVVGIANVSPEGLESGMGMAHAHAQEFFFETTNLVSTQFDIYKADPTLKTAVEQYKQTTAKVMVATLKRLQDSLE